MYAPAFTMTNDSIIIVLDGKSYSIQKGAPNFKSLRYAIVTERWTDIPQHLTVQKSLHTWAKGKFTLEGNTFKYNKEDLPQELNNRIISMASSGQDPTTLLKFWERLQANPSYRSVQMLFQFLKHEGIPLTEDGHFLAYKGVRNDYKDVHSGTFDNSPGAVNEMPRNKISDDPKVECHEGFHVGALAYAKSFSERVVVCKVDPADVVCVPYDHSQHKMRVAKYQVIGNHNGAHLPSAVFIKDEYDRVTSAAAPWATEPVKIKSEKAVRKKEKRSSNKSFAKYDKMGLEQLLECSIDDLRQYAGKGLEIIGASKIPGGKTALIHRILEVRK